MALITLEEFKTYLQLKDVTYDLGYAAFIAAVSADVEDMSNQRFDLEYAVTLTNSSNFISSDNPLYDIFEGCIVTGSGIPDRTIVQNTSLYQASVNKYATASGSITATFNPVPEQVKPVIANMIMYKIMNNTYTAGGEVVDLKSKSIGPLSLSFGTGAAIDRDYGYPKNLVKSIKRIKRIAFDKGETRIQGMDITNKRCY